MATTTCQLECEQWVRSIWLPHKFGQTFAAGRLPLDSGGQFEFDAISADGQIAASISTSCACTASGKRGAGKLSKIRADMLFLLMARVSRRLLVFSELDMYELCDSERRRGRVPHAIELHHAPLPPELSAMLATARAASSREVTPSASGSEHALRAQITSLTPSNATLIDLARKHPPPSSWFDEDVDLVNEAPRD
jgi:hypothetical protein